MFTAKRSCALAFLGLGCLVGAVLLLCEPLAGQDRPQRKLRVDPPTIKTDKSVKYDYDIVYVRAPRTVKGKDGKVQQASVWPDASNPENLRASTDLMLLHPNGKEEVLVEGGKGAIADPYVSFDAQWVYYSYFHDERDVRSEEHTSELQSLRHLVCRLLLEKKKK